LPPTSTANEKEFLRELENVPEDYVDEQERKVGLLIAEKANKYCMYSYIHLPVALSSTSFTFFSFYFPPGCSIVGFLQKKSGPFCSFVSSVPRHLLCLSNNNNGHRGTDSSGGPF
jgi:hypothetical protein